MLYPLKFTPRLFHKIWGGKHIKEWYRPLSDEFENVGESWLISAVDRFPTEVENGRLAGNELQELLEVYMNELVGDSVYEVFGNTFPLLTKFIDADDDLSIQVHPNDEQAAQMENSLGKTEMWYVVEGSQPEAAIIAGWNEPMSEDKVLSCLKDGTLAQKMHEYKVKAGDVIMINTGLVHALKKGTMVAEIQENSDITYRLYDYDRIGNDGKKRPLKLKEALQVLNYDEGRKAVLSTDPDALVQNIAQTPYFTTNVLTFSQTIQRDYAPLDSFVIYMCVEGGANVEALDAEEEKNLSIQKGEALLIPAVLNDIRITPTSSTAKLLEVYIEID